MEVKASFLTETAVAQGGDTFLKEIRAKYGAAEEKGERDKGVAQLARSIGAIMRGEWLGPRREFAEIKIIYPVLIAHDARLDAPALGHFLENEFRQLLGPVPSERHVAPLTVITINDLENLEESCQNLQLGEPAKRLFARVPGPHTIFAQLYCVFRLC